MLTQTELNILKYRRETYTNKTEYTRIKERFVEYEKNENAWNRFFELEEVTQDDVILDFGCAVGFSILFGKKLGYNVRGLDVIYEGPYKGVDKYRDQYGTTNDIDIYDGYKLPYEDNSFTIIVCRASLDKFNTDIRNDNEETVERLIDLRLKEFDRILTGKRLVITSTNKFVNRVMLEAYNIEMKKYKFIDV